jgi:hypothetical protein
MKRPIIVFALLFLVGCVITPQVVQPRQEDQDAGVVKNSRILDPESKDVQGTRYGFSTLDVQVLSENGEPWCGGEVLAIEHDIRLGLGGLSKGGKIDERGKSALLGLRPCNYYDIFLSHPSHHAPMHRQHLYISPGKNKLILRASEEFTIRGEVIEEEGKPVVGAFVGLRLPGRLAARCENQFGAITDANGSFVIKKVNEGVWTLVAVARGQAGWLDGVRAGTEGARILLRKTRTVFAKELPDEFLGSKAILVGLDVPFRLDGVVDDRGEFDISGIHPGTYHLVFNPLPFFHPGGIVNLGEEGPPSVPISFRGSKKFRMLEFRGRVLRKDGSPAGHAEVGLFHDQYNGFLSCMHGTVKADEEGRFRLATGSNNENLVFRVLGKLDGMVGASDVCRAGDPIEIILGKDTHTLDIRVKESGTYKDLLGVNVYAASPLVHCRGTTGPNGKMVIRNISPFDLTESLHSPDSIPGLHMLWRTMHPGVVEVKVAFPPWHFPQRQTVFAGKVEKLGFVLERAPVVEGQVLDEVGRPAAGIRIRTVYSSTDTDSEGNFVLIGSRPDADLTRLAWSPLPYWGSVESLRLLKKHDDDGTFRIPDARRWPMELSFPSKYAGMSVTMTLPDSKLSPRPRPHGTIDRDGRCLPGMFLSGRYRVWVQNERFAAIGKIRRPRWNAELTLRPDPPEGVWRVIPQLQKLN